MIHRLVVRTAVCIVVGSVSALGQSLFKAPRILTEGGTILAVGDLDNDGDPDLATRSGSQLITLLNDGAGTFSTGPAQVLDPGSTTGGEPARLADINGDNRPDLVMSGGFAMHIYPGTAGGGFGPVVVAPVPAGVSAFDFGDMNGDGRDDIAICSTNVMQFGWLFHNGTSFQTTAFPTITDFPAEVAALDYTGDGVADMVVTLSDLNQVLLVPTVAGQPDRDDRRLR